MTSSSMRVPGMAGIPTIGASAPPATPAPTGGPLPPFAPVVDVTEASFQVDVIQRSMSVPVVIDFWAEWCEPCKQLGPILEKLAVEANGSWVLAKLDVDANPRIAQAAEVQGIPAVKAVLKGQVVDLFTGSVSEAQARQVLDQLIEVAKKEGLIGAVADGEPLPPPLDPDLLRGDEAFAEGNFDAAEAAYQSLLDREPRNQEAKASIARVKMVRRASELDQEKLQQDIAADPTAVANVKALADLFVLSDRLDDAFEAMIAGIKRESGPERDELRNHLIELFLAVGDEDPRVGAARRALANALF